MIGSAGAEQMTSFHLESELGHVERARELARHFDAVLNDVDAPARYVLEAVLLEREGRAGAALGNAERAAALDPRHAIAVRMRAENE